MCYKLTNSLFSQCQILKIINNQWNLFCLHSSKLLNQQIIAPAVPTSMQLFVFACFWYLEYLKFGCNYYCLVECVLRRWDILKYPKAAPKKSICHFRKLEMILKWNKQNTMRLPQKYQFVIIKHKIIC